LETRSKIAIVDDDAGIRETLATLLQENGYDAVPLTSIQDFMDLGSRPNIDLVLIDLKLRGESGLTLAVHVRLQHDIPIIMLTGVGDEFDKIVGLETGADDYLMKPFNPRELIARIKAVLRRYGVGITAKAPLRSSGTKMLSFGEFALDTEKRELMRRDGDEIPLTNSEYKILQYLAKNPNRIVPRPELLEELGGDLSRFMDRTIDVMILRLRRKIETVPSKPIHLQTRRGQGYVFVNGKKTADL
jgi:two-component system, OmpR family, response regulator